MSLLQTWRFLADHPLCADRRWAALVRFVRWQLGSRLADGPIVCPFVNGAKLLATRGMTGATGNVYAGLHEFEDMGFVLHALRPGDTFVDIGANIGSYTILAAAVGASCEAFEPVPETFAWLCSNVRINGFQESVRTQQVAIGGATGTIAFTSGLDTVNHVVRDPGHEKDATITVPVTRLDDALAVRSATIIKVDVEGFETEVLDGGASTFADDRVGAVLMELNGSGARYGFEDRALHERMMRWGYVPRRYDPRSRVLAAVDTHGTSGNTIYVRSPAALQERLRAAPPFHVLGRSI